MSLAAAHKFSGLEGDFRRVVKALHRLGYLSTEDTRVQTAHRNEKVMAVCERVLGRKLGRFAEVSEAELAEVASVVGGKYVAPVDWGLLLRVKP